MIKKFVEAEKPTSFEDRIIHDATKIGIYPGSKVECPLTKEQFIVPAIVKWYTCDETNIITTENGLYICAGPERWCKVIKEEEARKVEIPSRSYVTQHDLAKMVSIDIGSDITTTKRVMAALLRAIVICCDNDKTVSIHGFGQFWVEHIEGYEGVSKRSGKYYVRKTQRYIEFRRQFIAQNTLRPLPYLKQTIAWAVGMEKCAVCDRYVYSRGNLGHDCKDPLL